MEINVARTLSVIAVCAAVTFASRLLPFLIFRSGKVPKLVEYLGRVLPMAIMCVLVFYCLKGVRFQIPQEYLPELIALAVTVGIHLWQKKTFLSILSGTVCYMVLVQLLL